MKNYNYEVDTESNNAWMSFKIVENNTGHIIRNNVSQAAVKSMTGFYNNGGGFAGWTPDFFMNRWVINI